jgi:hypothetical protein
MLKKPKTLTWNKLTEDNKLTYPNATRTVLIKRKDGKEEEGYWYNSRISGRTWIDSEDRRIINNPVTHWKEIL